MRRTIVFNIDGVRVLLVIESQNDRHLNGFLRGRNNELGTSITQNLDIQLVASDLDVSCSLLDNADKLIIRIKELTPKFHRNTSSGGNSVGDGSRQERIIVIIVSDRGSRILLVIESDTKRNTMILRNFSCRTDTFHLSVADELSLDNSGTKTTEQIFLGIEETFSSDGDIGFSTSKTMSRQSLGDSRRLVIVERGRISGIDKVTSHRYGQRNNVSHFGSRTVFTLNTRHVLNFNGTSLLVDGTRSTLDIGTGSRRRETKTALRGRVQRIIENFFSTNGNTSTTTGGTTGWIN
mmetsp:Transcript_38485/g.43707  ORF Transcript_38485/g.43707 Transcript_38485/m.43707 type:complete len:293 (-) Transcript_38485:160-1038(-)